MAARVTQERTLGAILGLAIGDALGMPVTGMSPAEIERDFGPIDRYFGRTFPDGAELAPGEFTDETEIALCIMETYTSANGDLYPDLIRARMQCHARDGSRRWSSPETLRALAYESKPPDCATDPDDPEVALRGVPIGVIHAAPVIDEAALVRDVETVVGLTHCNRPSRERAVLVATAVARVLAGTSTQATLMADLGISDERSSQPAHEADAVVASALSAFVAAERFEDAVATAAQQGGAADARAALAGVLAGAHFGAGGIPQNLIDQLEGRIYLTLAAPWFYRTVQLMSGRGISIGRNGH